jgi:glycosyltransferase involved in cell wall biosynthesis
MRVHILYEIKDGPWGGGNQFLKSLKKYFQSRGVYEDDLTKADAILFNSHQHLEEVSKAKFRRLRTVFIHRIDGPTKLYNKASDRRDDIVSAANRYMADATVFQSNWSRKQNYQMGLSRSNINTVISNAPDATIFNRHSRAEFTRGRKTRLVAASWSPNWNKGFAAYQWLDENLDFDKYEMKFIGKTPIEFKNIRYVQPVPSKDVAAFLKQSDIFIFASAVEACSNCLLEALHCGLPVVGINQSSTPELIAKGGEVFDRPQQIPELLEKIENRYAKYQAAISNPSIDQVGKQYYDFINEVRHRIKIRLCKRRSFGLIAYARLSSILREWRRFQNMPPSQR